MYDFKRLSLILSALVVTGTMSNSAGAVSYDDLTKIHGYVENQDADGLQPGCRWPAPIPSSQS